MRTTIVASWASLVGVAWGGLEALSGHWDITPTYSVSTQEWTWTIEEGPVVKSPETSFFPAFDGDYFSGEGERIDRPSGADWDFLGVEAGEPVWIFPESTTYGTQTEPGLGDTQSGTFSGNLRVTLSAVDGPPGGFFSLFDLGGTYMASSDGIDSSDVLSKPSFHSHFNWGFSQKGMWCVKLQVMGYLGPGQTNPTPMSAEVPLHFAIGGVARWRASNFSSSVVMSEAIAGADADADGDRLPNLVEYALGGDPNDGNAFASEHGGKVAPEVGLDGGRLTISFHRRTDPLEDEGILIEVEWADDLSGPWLSGGTEIAETPVGSDWDRVTVRDNAPNPGSARFARVVVTEVP